MVSTRGIKYRFTEGEKVLCYEPDITKARVLYDSKVLGISEARDKRGRRIVQYKIHFQGWNSSWDRKVNSDLVLKDTEENRQLQKNLAEKAQLQLGAYLYRRDRKKRVRNEKTVPDNSISPTSRKIRGSSEDNSSCSTLGKLEADFGMRDDCDTESYSSSVESFHEEDRVLLKIGDKLKEFLEYDYDMIVNHNKQHILPPRVTAITILENFVKQSAIKLVFSSSQPENPRRRNPQSKVEKKEKEFEKLFNTVTLLKEVADGLRVYLNFTITDYLLYKNEKEEAAFLLSDKNLKNFNYLASVGLSPDFLLPKSDSELLFNLDNPESRTNNTNKGGSDVQNTNVAPDEPLRRKLRSCRSDDCDVLLENCLSSKASNSSGSSTPHASSFNSSNLDFLKSFSPITLGIPVQVKEFLQKVLSWQLLPSNSEAEPSMMFGATHLARLIVKLPDFLNASTISDDKLKILLQHLDSFVLYLESHKEWFSEQNYFKDCPQKFISSPKE
ncbi:protein male-specific lethal-3 isoform X2 [Condylostylus longicornis]|uniref:protein male-specific lethal-3 isoform X2 n=1 Tax=Condylostylus longicornis TaxID=2530218 RepID=UPI00244DAA1D|nr:protein male-specific lethal-3 isoform X2 [Condylostylus longicornis]